jgi:dipeptidyl aminopeptidase/acylaminoacyl peptidase
MNLLSARPAGYGLGLLDLYRFRLPEQVALAPDGLKVATTIRWADREADRWRTSLSVLDAAVPGGAIASDDGGSLDLGLGTHTPCWSPAGGVLAFLSPGRTGQSLRIWDEATGSIRELADGLLAPGHLAWSPDGLRLAFVAAESEDRGNGRTPRPRVFRECGYKVDGAGLLPPGRRSLFVVNPATGETRRLTSGDGDVHGVSWSPDGTAIAFAWTVQRGMSAGADLWLADVGTEEVSLLWAWGGTLAWSGWTPDGEILFCGQAKPGPCQTGRLCRLDREIRAPHDLLGDFSGRIMASGSGIPPAALVLDDGRLLFCARNGGRTWVYSVAVTGGPVIPWLTGDSLVVQALSAAGKKVALIVASDESAGEVCLADAGVPVPVPVTRLNPWIDTSSLIRPEEITFTAADDTVLHGYFMCGRPVGAQGPTLVDIHGGPDNVWRPTLAPHYLYRQVLARRGWNILLLNPRGSDGHGAEYMRAPLGMMGFSEEHDFLSALDQLVGRGLADECNVAVMGASHGGFMANWLIARTDRFAAAISTACVANWTSLYGTSSLGHISVPILLGGTPDQVPERYRECSPLTHLSGRPMAPLLLIHGENDLMNPIGQSEEWFTALRRAESEVEFVRYPSADHLFMYNGFLSHQIDYVQRVVSWLIDRVEKAATC